MAAALAPIGASAAPAMPQSKLVDRADAGSLVQQVRHSRGARAHRHVHRHHHHHRRYRGGGIVVGGYCVAWRAECGARYGWGTGAFYRCLARHGC